jgi:hypothetical protein
LALRIVNISATNFDTKNIRTIVGLLRADSLLLMSLDAADKNDKHTLLAAKQPNKELIKEGELRKVQVDVPWSE